MLKKIFGTYSFYISQRVVILLFKMNPSPKQIRDTVRLRGLNVSTALESAEEVRGRRRRAALGFMDSRVCCGHASHVCSCNAPTPLCSHPASTPVLQQVDTDSGVYAVCIKRKTSVLANSDLSLGKLQHRQEKGGVFAFTFDTI